MVLSKPVHQDMCPWEAGGEGGCFLNLCTKTCALGGGGGGAFYQVPNTVTKFAMRLIIVLKAVKDNSSFALHSEHSICPQ